MLTFKFYFLGKFQLYSAMLPTIVTMIYIRSSDLIHGIAKNSALNFSVDQGLTLATVPVLPWS